MRSVLLLALLPAFAIAQSPAPSPETLGVVTGHITCNDTQRPARLAEVRLISVRTPSTDVFGYHAPTVGSGVVGLAVYTDLTGGYTIADVEPGQYYLRVDLTGYATPISQFTAEEFKSPTPRVQQRIQRELQLVTVTPNATVRADATLRRGGSISGTVTFDDGSPAIAIRVSLLRRDADGKLQAVRNGVTAITNGRGQFGIESLSPGEYVLETKLITFEPGQGATVTKGAIKTTPEDSATSALPVYSGNVYRQKDAAIIKVDAGQETGNADISIPLDRLHEISGTLLAKDGHAINSGQIELLDPDTREPVATTWTRDEGVFHLLNVPEGSYILKVTDASDVGSLEIHYAPNHTVSSLGRPTLHTYGDLEQPLIVQGDIPSLLITVPEKGASTPTVSTSSE